MKVQVASNCEVNAHAQGGAWEEYRTHFSILQMISEGTHILSRISSHLSVKGTSLTKYLHALEGVYDIRDLEELLGNA
jgi:hypothetical protein